MNRIKTSGETTKQQSMNASRRWRKVALYLAATLAALYSFWPIMIMALEGYNIDLGPVFAGRAVRTVGGLQFQPGIFNPSPSYYLQALSLEAYPKLVADTLVIAALSIGLALAVGIPVAYVTARIEVKGKTLVAYLLLALRTASQFVVIIPLYIAYARLGLYDNFTGIALAEQLLILTVVVWMLRGFFIEIPKEVYEAATVFGKNEWQVFRRVIFPMVTPGVVVTTLFALVLLWNEFLIADTLTGQATRTVSVGVWEGMSINQISISALAWNSLNAAGTLAYIPAIVVLLLIRRYFARGFRLGLGS